ncbi:MAG: hypothetical protein M1837_006487 [Sclerophora amabilis]|nr:MAG: hypothetical protein M1837_006487 [Sclerophora amabilis]
MSSQPPQRSFSFEQHDDDDAPPRQDRSYNAPPYEPTRRDHQVAPHPAYSSHPPSRGMDFDPPPPPAHHRQYSPPSNDRYNGQSYGQHPGHPNSFLTSSSPTPGMDNLGDSSAGGGIAGIALGVAAHNERDSGLQASAAMDGRGRSRGVSPASSRGPYQSDNVASYELTGQSSRQPLHQQTSYSSTAPLAAAAQAPSFQNPSTASLSSSSHDRYAAEASGDYMDNPYSRYSTTWDPRMSQSRLADFDPNEIEDDGDDMMHPTGSASRSMLSSGHRQSSQNMLEKDTGAAAGAGGAAAGGIMGTLGGFVGRSMPDGADGGRSASGSYGPVPGGANTGGNIDKSEWLARQGQRKKRSKWIVAVFAILLVAAIVGGTVGGVLASRSGGSSGGGGRTGKSAKEDDGNGDLHKDSTEIKDLMGNKDLHRVFPGMDYTPFNTQYPECLTDPPSQNNVTRDMAVLSQLTNRVRLYGTDCNQTQMVLHSIERLELTDVKVWLGVWLGSNDTTNKRQLDQMYKLLDEYEAEPFAGIIVGNEVLYREDLTPEELAKILAETKKKLTSKKIDLPVATSDLGDNWTPELASEVDIVMANVHPFFAGTPVSDAAGWTWSFWQNKDVPLAEAAPNKPKSVVSEVGWPSEGGNNCSPNECKNKKEGSVATVENMNEFMGDFVCQSMKNGTEYFWFSAFDEPWKAKLNEPGKEWEDRWGLMDSDRNMKKGLKIPDCDGKTIGS